jgi:hypothetical protein
VLSVARLILTQMEECGETVWQHEETPEALKDRATGH